MKDRAKAIMTLLANLKVESSDDWSEAWEKEIIERTRKFRESAEDLRGAAAKTRTEVGRVCHRCIRQSCMRNVEASRGQSKQFRKDVQPSLNRAGPVHHLLIHT